MWSPVLYSRTLLLSILYAGFPSSSDCQASSCCVGDPTLIPGLGRSPGEENGHPLQYSCLEKSMDRGAWWATVQGVVKSWTRLSDSHTHSIRHSLHLLIPSS